MLCLLGVCGRTHPADYTSRPFLSMKKSLIFAIVLFLGSCTPYANADMITNNGSELRILLEDASKLTPEQLLLLKDMAKDQLASAEKLVTLDTQTILAAKQAEQDRILASRVIYAAFLFVGVVIAALLTPYLRRRAA